MTTLSSAPILLAREGFHAPGIEEFDYPCYTWSTNLLPGWACINRANMLMILVTLVVGTLFLLAFRRPQMVPRGLQNVMESGIDFVRDQIILQVIGPKGLRFLPYLTTLFVFIFFANVLEIIPFINFPVTSRMALPAFFAITSWAMFIVVGMKEQGPLHYWKSSLFPPGVPLPLYIILTPIEFVSTFLVRPLTLSVRLLANMIAGHLILGIFFLGTVYLLAQPKTFVFGLGAGLMSIVLVGFELLVAALQAYIFVILTAVYLAGSLEPAH